MVRVDLTGAKTFFDPTGPDISKISDAHRTLFEHTGEGAEFTLRFDEPQWAVTPGQSAVLYDGDVCLGGGIIV